MTTKVQVLASFRKDILPAIIRQYGRDDHIAIREAWNNYTDTLCKAKEITRKQYDTWINPF